MIQYSIKAPTGAGMGKFIADKVKCHPGREVLIIVPAREIGEQWKRDIPAADIITYHRWLSLGLAAMVDKATLIIVSQLGHPNMLGRLALDLHACPNEVWLLNMDIPPNPLAAPQQPVCPCGRGYGSRYDGKCTSCRGHTAWAAQHIKGVGPDQ